VSVFAPGQDSPTAGYPSYNPGSPSRPRSGGVFAQTILGATPKYALNNGSRGDPQFKNSLARIFVQLDPSEMGQNGLFLQSIADTQVRNNLAPRLTGQNIDPTQRQTTGSVSGSSGNPGPTGHLAQNVHSSGYLDFLITNLQIPLTEKFQVTETLSDNYVAFFFGQSAPVIPVSGMLINSVQDDQATNFLRLYVAILRGTQMARRQKSMSIRFDSFVINGVMTNIQLAYKSDNELLVPFSFNLLVKRIFITNYTRDWQPTVGAGQFVADPHVVLSDGRPVNSSAQTAIVATTPQGTTLTPTGQGDGSDGRTQQAPPAAVGPVLVGLSGLTTTGQPVDPAFQNILNSANTMPSSSSPTPPAQGPASTQVSSGVAAYSSQPETVGAPNISSNPDVRPTRPVSGG
jgi:hypothetical protein